MAYLCHAYLSYTSLILPVWMEKFLTETYDRSRKGIEHWIELLNFHSFFGKD